MAGKTNYFGTFLDTLNMPTPGQVAQPKATPTLDALLKVWPDKDAMMTVGDVAGAFNLTFDTAADVLLKAQGMGLAANNSGKFTLTPDGMDALKKVKRL